jgi:hypothetical protein
LPSQRRSRQDVPVRGSGWMENAPWFHLPAIVAELMPDECGRVI